MNPINIKAKSLFNKANSIEEVKKKIKYYNITDLEFEELCLSIYKLKYNDEEKYNDIISIINNFYIKSLLDYKEMFLKTINNSNVIFLLNEIQKCMDIKNQLLQKYKFDDRAFYSINYYEKGKLKIQLNKLEKYKKELEDRTIIYLAGTEYENNTSSCITDNEIKEYFMTILIKDLQKDFRIKEAKIYDKFIKEEIEINNYVEYSKLQERLRKRR